MKPTKSKKLCSLSPVKKAWITRKIKNGKSKIQISKELGIKYNLVKKYTRDTPRRHIHTKKEIKKIRKLVKEVGVKSEVARRLGIPYHRVIDYTRDIKVKNKTLFGGKTMGVLQELMENGYAYITDGKATNVHILKKYFPKIQMTRAKGRRIAFLPERKEDAMKALLGKIKKKVWSYQELKRVTKLFNADLTRQEKQRYIGKNKITRGEITEKH